ncbi:MAG: 30S ribosomal protein S18 [Candidatus Levybacteria bacterium]|nr:30S ribosomal protein S18 [Candidatus Levybacteria bacterium]MBI2421084.1 30S ribosomal protein S18 [Candidatus Levybacteria bacterium]
MAKAKQIRRKVKSSAPKDCYFCTEKKDPSFHDMAIIGRYVTERGKIVPRSRSGICSKHQKSLARNVKYARHLALLPFIIR